jgi:hypothetical protein
VILTSDWLAQLARALDQPRAGLVSATGSWASIRSLVRFQLGLGGRYSRLLGDRRTVTATFEAITGPPSEAAPSGRKIPVLTYGSLLLDQLRGSVSFPATHIRTAGFMINHDVFDQLHIPTIRRKNDAYRLESGRRSLTAQVQGLGLDALVVGADGRAYGKDDWAASRTFWQGDQENLMIADKQTAFYEQGDLAARTVLSRYAWGELADPSPAGTSATPASGQSAQRAAQDAKPRPR